MFDHAAQIAPHLDAIRQDWRAALTKGASRAAGLLTPSELEGLTRAFLQDLVAALPQGLDPELPAYDPLKRQLSALSANFAERGLTPSETAMFVFSLKEALAERYTQEAPAEALWPLTQLLDRLGLYTFESYMLVRERVIRSQAESLADLSTPVIKVWDGIVALPLVGAIDSARAKEIMEKLLEAVSAQAAEVAIIDITGVPVVDTQVANRIMRTVEAVRLLGTQAIVTGINPIIAQTLVQLGVDLGQLTTKATLHAGLKQALRARRLRVVALAETAR